MYRKTLIALACAVISAPAFAQSPCPEGLGRPPHDGWVPQRYDTPCTYLRNPSQPADLGYHGNPGGSNGPDYHWGQSMPQLPSTSLTLPQGPFIGGGMGGGQVGGWEWKR